MHTLKIFLLLTGFVWLGHFLDVGGPARIPERTDLTAALQSVRTTFRAEGQTFTDQLAGFRMLATDTTTRLSLLREHHLALRRQYKKLEFLLAYLDPEGTTRYLNGAPLPKTEPGVPAVVVLPPRGLQTIDELLFGEAPDRTELLRLTVELERAFIQVWRPLAGQSIQHHQVFEALRQQVVRVYTLGLTGFDTPGSVAALPEARTALTVLRAVVENYAPALAAQHTELLRSLMAALGRAEELLATDDFDNFGRLTFLREVVNPLTRDLPLARAALLIESSYDVRERQFPLDPTAPYLFSDNWLNPDYFARLEDSPVAAQRTALGELLFFDPILSKNGQLSCASCHRPERAFTDGKGSLDRNSPTLINSVFAEKYFYDLREEFLERQMKHVVSDHREFATDFVTIERRLRGSETYKKYFAGAYGDQPKYQLSRWSISDALTRYVASLRAFDSPFDRYARGETDALPPAVVRGHDLFMGRAVCGTCHFAPTFSGLVPPYYRESESEVLGVPAEARWTDARLDPDPGRAANDRPEDEAAHLAFSFKTPTVRNAAVTAPYMHNGVYGTLEEVVRFYQLGGGAGIGIELEHQTLPFDSLSLSERDQSDLVAFLNSLTDFESLNRVPTALPHHPEWPDRQVGGTR